MLQKLRVTYCIIITLKDSLDLFTVGLTLFLCTSRRTTGFIGLNNDIRIVGCTKLLFIICLKKAEFK